jgi:hypothetical protein
VTKPFGIKSHPELIARSFDKLERSKILRISHLEGTNQFVLRIEMQNKGVVELQAAALELLSGQLPEFKEHRAEKAVGVGRGRGERLVSRDTVLFAKGKANWTIPELEAAGMPMYYSKEWLENEITRLGSLAAIGRAHGYKITTLERWRMQHGITMLRRAANSVSREEFHAAWQIEKNHRNLREFAAAWGVSLGWASEALRRVEMGEEQFKKVRDETRKKQKQAERDILRLWDAMAAPKKVSAIIDLVKDVDRKTVYAVLKRERGFSVKPRRRRLTRAKSLVKSKA